ncbi:ComF family protein [Aliidiomarina minuta]|uniref:ComF family protein n=1 Tax=Aliidiomarina minuta TaxID=880057 RepID=UPI000F87E847|nr:ComF family protein [Aliidiomarina minuta]
MSDDYCRVWIAALSYQPPVDRWLHSFKFAQTPALARHLAILLSAQVMTYYKQHKRLLPEALIAVPLAKKRWRYRGYNQALVLANEVSKVLGIPLIHAVIRHKDSKVQHQLDRRQRQANMRQAFQVVSVIPCTRIAIVDDIITTGATVSGLGAVLSEQGVVEIDAWAVAYTPS